MDINQSEKKSIESVKAAIASGKLTREEIMKRLRGAIAQEERKPIEQQDHEQIMLYDQLLYELETGKRYVSRREEALRAAKAHLAELDQRKARLRPVKWIAVILAAMLVLVVGAEVLLHREWLFGKPSEDGQQYIIQGEKIDPGLVAESNADIDDSFERITTNSFDHAVMVLGYTPHVPTWVPDGWQFQSYYARKSETMTWFVVSYQNVKYENLLNYEERRYNNADYAKNEIEQDASGEVINVSGKTAYYRTNMNSSSIAWTNKLMLHNIVGPIDKPSLIKMRESINEE